MVSLATRALEGSVRPRRLAGVVARPLNFTVRSPTVSARVQLRVIALLYAVFAAANLLYVVWALTASPSPPGALADQVHAALVSKVPGALTVATIFLALSGLSLVFPRSKRSWQIATTAGSVLLSLWFIWVAARFSADEIPYYLSLGEGYSTVALLLGFRWGLALVFSFCSYLLWRQLRAPDHRWRGP